MSTWLTVPTRGDRPSLLALVDECGIPRTQIVLVHTDQSSPWIPGCVNVSDFAAPNIHRWWNWGIDIASRAGAEVVVVANDDIRVGSTAELDVLARAAAPVSYVAPGRPGPQRITGWCWAIRPASTPIRPDVAYSWWFGDDQLEIDLIAAGTPPVATEVDVAHLRFDASMPDLMRPLVEADAALFEERNRRSR